MGGETAGKAAETKAAVVGAAAKPKGAAKPSVWVVMKDQANLAQLGVSAKATKDWKARGQQVVTGLTSKASTSQTSIRAFLAARGATFKPFWVVNTIKVTADQATIDELAKRPDVARIVPDATYALPPPQPGANQSIQAVEWGLANIHAPEVWAQFGAQGDGIVVANIDTGVQFDHPALVRQYRGNRGDGTFDHNYNWFDPASICGFPSLAPCDNVAHGSHTMGTMVGDDQGDNQIGVAPHARWIAAKGCEFNSCSLESLLAAGQWVMAPTDLNGANPRPDLRPHIVNNSWGGGGADPFFQATVQAWVAAGMFPSFSNGNSGPSCGSAGSPGDYPESYAAGAYDINNFLAFFSSRGPSFLDGGIKPNIAAPGVDVRSSVPGNSYAFFSGTSMAAPHVSGSVALIWSAAPSLIGDVAGTRALLDQTAVDTPDFSCGGAPENNNAFGQGRLDVLAAVSQAPTGPTGTLQGTVTDPDGGVVAGALVHAQGPSDRRAFTDEAGAYNMRLPEGTYTVTVTKFGFLAQTVADVAVAANATTQQDFHLVRAPSFTVSGFVRDSSGQPVSGAQVSLGDPQIPAVASDATGRYAFPFVPAGDYQLTAQTTGGCYGTATTPVSVVANTAVDLTLALRVDGFGYVCRHAVADYVPANDVLPLSGDDGLTQVTLPFPFPYYGQSYTSANISTNGVVNFQPTFPSFSNTGIPDPFEPNAAIFTFWDDLFVDFFTGTVRTSTIGQAPNRQFVVEWRDVSPLGRSDLRMTFEVLLSENGSIRMHYQSVEPDQQQRGGFASVGIENETGTVGLPYSINTPALFNGLSVVYTLPPSGVVTGTVTEANSGQPLAGVRVQASQNGVPGRAVTSDAQGAYSLRLAVGDYTITASVADYATETTTVSVADNAVITRNFAMRTGRAALTPANVQLTVPVGQVRTRTLALSNSGTAAFDFSVNESGGAAQSTVATMRLARNPSANPNARTTRDLFAPGIQARGLAPMAAGDVIRSFPPTGMQLAWGVGFTGNVWLSDAFALSDVEFTTLGAATGRGWPTPWAGGFPADIAYVPARNLLCQVAAGNDNGIHCVDPATGTEQAVIAGGNLPWTFTSQRGLAYRSDDDSFYIGGWNEGIVYHVRGLGAATPGEIISSCRPADGNISGLAWNGAARVLWVATNSPSDTIYEINPDDCTVLSTLAHPQPGFNGGGLDMDQTGNLWMIGQNPNNVFLVESGVPAFADVPWLSVSPTTGSVAPGATQSLQVRVDTHGLAPGLYLASLFVQTTAAREKLLRVPISLFVPDYQQGVNAGGTGAYVDTLGDTWATDQKFVTGSWGYFQKSKTASTTHAITGTPDQTLFKSQRIDPYAYRFEGLPSGTYQVELRFAEIDSKVKPGKRLFDVIVEDTIVLPAHDINFEVGQFAAESRQFFAEITDGRLDVRLVPRAKSEPPVINAVRITHRNDR